MATAQETINLALRKLRILPPGRGASTFQSNNALADLNALFLSMLEFTSSHQVQNVRTNQSYWMSSLSPAVRIQSTHGTAVTMTLPEGSTANPVQDGSIFEVIDVSNNAATYNITIDRNGWLINGAASNVVISTNGGSKTYFFRAELGDWKPIADIGLTDELPFPEQFHFGLGLLLAQSLQGEYGQRLGGADLAAANRCKKKIRSRYAKPMILRPEAATAYVGGALPGNWWGISETEFLNGE
jgi:hypothetical protein